MDLIRKTRKAASRTRLARFGLLMGGCALILTSGCVTTTVSLDAQPEVSESRAKRDLGIDYLSTGRTAMAIRQLSASLKLDPKDGRTHLWLGEAYRRKGRNQVAEQYLRDAIKFAPRTDDVITLHEAMLNLSALLSQTGRYEESIEVSDTLAEDATLSTPWRPLTNSGWALMKLGRLDEARSRLIDALDFFPTYGPALLNLGILEAKQGHRMAAIQALERSIDRLGFNGRAEAHYRLGELYVALGRRDRAVIHFREAVEEAPDLDWGSQSQAYLDLLH